MDDRVSPVSYDKGRQIINDGRHHYRPSPIADDQVTNAPISWLRAASVGFGQLETSAILSDQLPVVRYPVSVVRSSLPSRDLVTAHSTPGSSVLWFSVLRLLSASVRVRSRPNHSLSIVRYPETSMHLQERAVRAPLDLFHRTYHSLLRSTGEIQIQALAEQYAAFEPSLHHAVHAPTPDLAALTYTSLRLPACIDSVRLVLLGQSHEVFARHGYGDVMYCAPRLRRCDVLANGQCARSPP
jgi:hypothetical protein